MAYIVPTRQETLADRALYTQSRLVELACSQCQARVMVRKNSEHHTSIQWTQDAVAACATFAELNKLEDGRPIHSSCPRLVASIDEAVRDGTVPIGSTDE
jgi:ribosomal protein L18